MKKILTHTLALFTLIHFASCKKDSTFCSENGTAKTSESRVKARTNITFDPDIIDNDVEIKTSLVKTTKFTTTSDVTLAYFNGNYSIDAIYPGEEDFLTNASTDILQTVEGGEGYDIVKRPLQMPGFSQDIQLSTFNYSQSAYTIRVETRQFLPTLTLKLYDAYKNTYTTINTSGSATYAVTNISINVASPGNAANRFKLVLTRS